MARGGARALFVTVASGFRDEDAVTKKMSINSVNAERTIFILPVFQSLGEVSRSLTRLHLLVCEISWWWCQLSSLSAVDSLLFLLVSTTDPWRHSSDGVVGGRWAEDRGVVGDRWAED